MSVYIITHKRIESPKLQGYQVIQVGAAGKESFGFLKDDLNDNISIKNPNYCELTGIYWIWKNREDDYVGIVHYRRFFSKSFWGKPILEEEIRSILCKYDVILPFCRKLKKTVREQYCANSGFKEDLKKIEEIIKRIYPDYLEDYKQILDNRWCFFFNMMISSKEWFDEYCKWLFSILFEFEKVVDFSEYNDYQKRVFGFISERLLTLYIFHNQYTVFEMGVVETEAAPKLHKRFLIALKRTVMYYDQYLYKGYLFNIWTRGRR